MSIFDDIKDNATRYLGFGPEENTPSQLITGRQFRIVDGAESRNPNNSNASLNKSPTFLDAIGRVSNIEALGDATKGLKFVSKLAAAGGPPLQNLINKGANGVMDAVAGTVTGGRVDSNLINGTLNKINPSAVNKTVASSNDLLDKLKTGDFNDESIPNYTRDFANIIKLGKAVINPFRKNAEQPAILKLAQSNYAIALSQVFGGAKLNYRYMITMEYNQPYQDLFQHLAVAFMAKQCDRPSMEYEFEDINMYNYRTKVAKKSLPGSINVSFYDDQLSHVIAFYTYYTNLMSPITNNRNSNLSKIIEGTGLNYTDIDVLNDAIQFGDTASVGGNLADYDLPNGGTNKIPTNIETMKHGASLGAYLEDNISIIKTMTIYHFYQGGAFCDVYKLYNPKIVKFEPDQLNSVGGTEANSMNMTLTYDYFTIHPFVETAKEQQSIIARIDRLTPDMVTTDVIQPIDFELPSDSGLKDYHIAPDSVILNTTIRATDSSSGT